MRLRHRKWADEVLESNKDIARNLSDFEPESIPTFQNLEIGSGQGGFLLEVCKLHPEEKYLGVEINKNAFALAVKHAQAVKEDEKNFLLLNAPIERIFPLIQEHQLNCIYLNFSDPWPKERSAGRRLTSPQFLKLYDRILKADGCIEFKTDNRGLFDYSVETIPANGWKIDAITYDLHNDDKMNAGNVMTEYEEKFSSKGNPIYKLIASRKA